ncbi:MAG: N-acetylglucosamine kinase [Acidimicrobiales bacterium]
MSGDGPELLAVGVDSGGTATRVLAVDLAGRRRGRGRAGGGNPTSHSPEAWSTAVADALGQALASSRGAEVVSVVVGMAGGGALLDPGMAARLDQTVRSHVGPTCRVQLTGDVVVAFSTGSPALEGTILVAGTGAAAASIRDRALAGIVDGHGWLLGDAGSGFWLGREAVRAALSALDARRARTTLLSPVVAELLERSAAAADARRTCVDLVHAVNSRPAVELARLAPLVSRCAAEGDPVALDIAHDAVSHLVSAVEAVRAPGDTSPLVVTGGVVVAGNLIGSMVRRQLEARWPGCVRPVPDGAAGAAWLALAAWSGADAPRAAELHRLITAQETSASPTG